MTAKQASAPWPAAAHPQLIDETTGTHGQDDIIEQVYQLGTVKVRVRVVRNSYANQSYALAEVLTPALTWTEVAKELSGNWHGTARDLIARKRLARKLADRAATILA